MPRTTRKVQLTPSFHDYWSHYGSMSNAAAIVEASAVSSSPMQLSLLESCPSISSSVMNLDDDLDIASMECPDKQQSGVYSGIHNSESSNVGEPTLLDRIYEELSPQLSLLSNVTIPCTPPKNLSPSSTFCDAMGNPQLHTAITCSPPSVPLQPFTEPLHPVNKELSPSVAEVNDNCETSSNISSSNISSKVREEEVSKNDAPTTLPSRHKAKSWSIKDDITLKNAVMKHGEKCWALMSSHYFDMRFTPAQCRSRWTKCINPELKKGKWTVEEDRILMECVERGVKKWSEIAKYIPGRQGKQVKERWANHLMPGIKKEKWSEEELKTLITEQRKIGNKWAEISKLLPGRTEHAIKNRWSTKDVRTRLVLYNANKN